jgi:hypothetical protein
MSILHYCISENTITRRSFEIKHFGQVWVLDAKLMDTSRPTWFPAQVTVDAQTDFRLMLEGQATNGGFAVDDLMFSPGSCSSEFILQEQV